MFLAKYDEFGSPLWAKQFGDTSNQYGAQLTVDPATGDVAIIVRLFGGVSFGPGSPTYQQQGSSDFVVALLDEDDNIYVGGVLYGSWDGRITANDGNESKPDAFFVKLSPTGDYQSGLIFGRTGSEFGQAIALDPSNGTLAFGGRFYGSSFDTGSGRLMGVSDDADGFLLKLAQP